ncbi:ATP-grasp domain-containing protein [Streptomyces sp. NPDC050619]|uniref:ATP-grasp domain-containing protein n=1 Tax=Streptomyces sp. NPDC050619 TaxID=3157214 RepID=UPI003421C3C2
MNGYAGPPAHPAVVVLGGRPDVVARAGELGVPVVLVHRENGYPSWVPALCERVAHADLADDPALERIVEETVKRRPVCRVLSLTEDGLLPAARLNDRLRLGGNSLLAVSRFKDKRLMRERLDECGLSPVRHREVSDVREAVRFAEESGGPAVLKPADGAGSQGVRVLDDPGEVAAQWPAFRAECPGPVLVEERLEGTEISVETLSARGRHVVLAMTEKVLVNDVVEVGLMLPARLSAELRAEAAGLTVAFLDAMELWEGPAHTELMLTAHGPRIIESQNRIGGSRLSELVRAATGVDMTRHAVTIPLGIEGLPSVPEARGGAAMRHVLPAPGRVVAIDVAPELMADPHVDLRMEIRVGDLVPPLRSGYDRVAGQIVATGADAVEAAARCERALRDVRVTTVPPT